MNRKPQTLILASLMLSGMAFAQPLMNPGLTPGNPLYGLDRASEKMELAFVSLPVIGGPELKSKVLANHAEERLAEARSMMKNNQSEKASKLLKQYNESLNKSIQNAQKANKTKLANRLKNVTQNHVNVLENVKKKVPKQAQDAIQKAINNVQKSQKSIGKPENPGKNRRKPKTPRKSPEKGKKGFNKTLNPEKPKTPGNKSRKLSKKTGQPRSQTDDIQNKSRMSPENQTDSSTAGNLQENQNTTSEAKNLGKQNISSNSTGARSPIS